MVEAWEEVIAGQVVGRASIVEYGASPPCTRLPVLINASSDSCRPFQLRVGLCTNSRERCPFDLECLSLLHYDPREVGACMAANMKPIRDQPDGYMPAVLVDYDIRRSQIRECLVELFVRT